MKTKIKFDNIDQQDDYIQSLSLKDLKKLNTKNNLVFQNCGEIIPETKFESPDVIAIDDYIQKLQLNELKKLFENSKSLNQIDENVIIAKSKLTGLDKNVILLIETKKEKATIEQIIIYCKGLHIPYQQLIPEFFIPIY